MHVQIMILLYLLGLSKLMRIIEVKSKLRRVNVDFDFIDNFRFFVSIYSNN